MLTRCLDTTKFDLGGFRVSIKVAFSEFLRVKNVDYSNMSVFQHQRGLSKVLPDLETALDLVEASPAGTY